jgi:hypothetical protein
VHHVERDDRVVLVAPEERAAVRVFDRVTPDVRVEERHAHADHAVAAVALRKRVAEHGVERRDVVRPRDVGTVRRRRAAP